MGRYHLTVYEKEDKEYARCRHYTSARAAVLDSLNRANGYYNVVLQAPLAKTAYGEAIPSQLWTNVQNFREQLENHVLSTKIQLNVDLDQDHATEDLLIAAIERKRNAA